MGKMIDLIKSEENWVSSLYAKCGEDMLETAVESPWLLNEAFPGRAEMIKLRAIKAELETRGVRYAVGIGVEGLMVVFTADIDGYTATIVTDIEEAYGVGEYSLMDLIKQEDQQEDQGLDPNVCE